MIDLLQKKKVLASFHLKRFIFLAPSLLSLRRQPEEHLPVSAGGLRRRDAQLLGAEDEQPRRGDALRGGGRVAAPGPRHVKLYLLVVVVVVFPSRPLTNKTPNCLNPPCKQTQMVDTLSDVLKGGNGRLLHARV